MLLTILIFFGLIFLDVLTFGLVSAFIFGFALMIQIFAYFILLEKMGEKGWKAVIPFYNEYLIFKHIWGVKFFFIDLVASFVNTYIVLKNRLNPGTVSRVIVIATGVTVCMFTIMYYMKLAAAFGKSKWWGLGLIIFPPLFIMLLAYSDAQFLGDDNYPAF